MGLTDVSSVMLLLIDRQPRLKVTCLAWLRCLQDLVDLSEVLDLVEVLDLPEVLD